jgi:putative membrane protein
MRKLLISMITLVLFTLSNIPYATAEDMPVDKSTQTAGSMPTTLSDSESAEVMVTLNESEVDLGQLAKRKASNKQVKDYAKMMVDQHKKNEKDTKKLARKQDLDFKKTDMSKSLEAEAQDMEKTLKRTAKEDFDRAYMDQQVGMHEKALDTVNTLISGAQNAAYKAHLEKTRDAITVHLAHAKEIKSMIQ